MDLGLSQSDKLHLGLKIWSSNRPLVSEVRRLHDSGVIHYVELYVVPGTAKDCCEAFSVLELPVVLHAPHFGAGFNLSLEAKQGSNRIMWDDVLRCADCFQPEGLIVHLGTHGRLSESIRQLQTLDRVSCPVWVENKPCVTKDESPCVGVTPSDIAYVRQRCHAGFCFDFGHAMCYAAATGLDHHRVMDEFMALKPNIFHLCDGKMGDIHDQHLHFGEGNYDLAALVNRIPDGAMVSLETPKRSMEELTYFEVECRMLHELRRS
ncbi:MAG TPA: hypothetical protein DCS88_13680 [Alphaproteobacteria bacterium]|nr:hypothetical protein [Alphaproteobacteria bacterium]